MAEIVTPREPTRRARRHTVVIMPAKVYANRLDDVELGLPLPLRNMDHIAEEREGLRLRQLASNLVADEVQSASVVGSSGNLTPSSTAEDFTESLGIHDDDTRFPSFWDQINALAKSIVPSRPRASATEAPTAKLKYESRFINPKVESFPNGFPRAAAFTTSTSDFMIFRGFKYCHGRILFQLEVEITELERALMELDKADDLDLATRYRLKYAHKEGWDSAQVDLIQKLRTKLKEYDETMLRFSHTQALGKTSPRNHNSVLEWIMQNKPLARPYYDFIYHSNDFLSIMGQQTNWFESFILGWVNQRPNSWIKRFLQTQKEREKTDNKKINYYDPAQVSALANILLVTLAVGLLFIPVFLLLLVKMSHAMMAVTALLFVAAFSTVISTMTGAKVYEVFFGSATYAAVLIVFLGSLNQVAKV
ncbi:hypothetical protein BGZ60DRAFT_523521 [Tricladium varicosporioides]|nr:hypothetical protein BGZ60DRAFT_523521 [Hymenoscyphus varicosporioides]